MSRARPRGKRFGVVSVVLVAVSAAAVSVPAAAAPAEPVPTVSPAATAAGQLPAALTPLGSASAGKALPQQRQGVVPGQVLLTLDPDTSVTGATAPGSLLAARVPQTSSAALDTVLGEAGATSLQPLFPALPSTTTDSLTAAARTQLGSGAPDLARTYVLRTRESDSTAVAASLQGAPGVLYAEPDRYVNTMNTGAQPIPAGTTALAAAAAPSAAKAASTAARTTAAAAQSGGSGGSGGTGSGTAGSTAAEAAAVPTNYALSSSAQALLNAGGVDAVGAFATLQGDFGQQPGAGEIVTNVSIGDLTDQSMADAGDGYVQGNGPTTVLENGQRYLDLPSMPLIPTYVADGRGGVDGSASTENQDPTLDEVMLDFSVMSPLAHNLQRPGMTGSGYSDLLGIAPGASYRLVVPQEPTTEDIAGALLAAAQQKPRPNVITASLGFGTDAEGYPSRYLEDDPFVRSVVASIVQQDGIVVSISSNDGTRLYTPTSVGPDGGSTPTELGSKSSATTIDDDANSTTPSVVPDSGAIAAGGTTLDDTLAVPAASGGDATTAETRISGFGTFSSGFGSRVDLSAPSDNVIAFSHALRGSAQDVVASQSGGTSASAPEIAAAAAVVLQAARLDGRQLSPAQVRALLEQTGHAVPTPSQIDQPLQVGPQIDVTAAMEKALGGKSAGAESTTQSQGNSKGGAKDGANGGSQSGGGQGSSQGQGAGPAIVRLSVAHRVTTAGLGSSFLETTDQNRIDLGDAASGGDGEGLVGPVTFAGDVVGLPSGTKAQYVLGVGSKQFRSESPAIRVTPRQLLSAAGLPVVSTVDRSVKVSYRVLVDGKVRGTVTRTMAIGPSDGTYVESTAPQAPAVVAAGHSVTVKYDLSGVSSTDAPELVVSGVGHWNPAVAPSFSAAWHTPLTATTGTVTIPATAFTGGGGLYGIGIAESGFNPNPTLTTWGEFAPIRVQGGSAADRPQAPVVAGTDGVRGHNAEVTRAQSAFGLSYDVRDVPGAVYAEAEFSAPAPTVYQSINTFTNANGSTLDNDGVDAPSSAHVVLSARSGTQRLDALALGLSTSSVYGVRILALDSHHRVVGQASPVSALSVDDGLAPGGSTVENFAMAGKDSVVALRTAAGGTEIRHYSTVTGRYGAVIAADTSAQSDYEVLGLAPAAHRTLLVHQAVLNGDVQVETWNTATNSLVGRTTLAAADYRFVTGQVDSVHARGAVLVRPVADGSDQVLPIDLADGTVGAPIAADLAGVPAGSYDLMAVDPASGDVYLGKQASVGPCFGSVVVPGIDLGARTVADEGVTSRCSQGIVSDGAGSLYNVSASTFSTKIVPTTVLGALDEATGTAGDPVSLRLGFAESLAVDGRHKVALVAFGQPLGLSAVGGTVTQLDNNATGQLMLVDLATGLPVRSLAGFEFGAGSGRLLASSRTNSIQLDPATRTGWTYGAYDEEIRQFSY